MAATILHQARINKVAVITITNITCFAHAAALKGETGDVLVWFYTKAPSIFILKRHRLNILKQDIPIFGIFNGSLKVGNQNVRQSLQSLGLATQSCEDKYTGMFFKNTVPLRAAINPLTDHCADGVNYRRPRIFWNVNALIPTSLNWFQYNWKLKTLWQSKKDAEDESATAAGKDTMLGQIFSPKKIAENFECTCPGPT